MAIPEIWGTKCAAIMAFLVVGPKKKQSVGQDCEWNITQWKTKQPKRFSFTQHSYHGQTVLQSWSFQPDLMINTQQRVYSHKMWMENRPKGSRAIGSGDQNSFIVESFRGKKALTGNNNKNSYMLGNVLSTLCILIQYAPSALYHWYYQSPF